MRDFEDFHRASIGIETREQFWLEQAQTIDWQRFPSQACDHSRAPFVQWFADGRTNLCYNAVDRHLSERAKNLALIAISTETNAETTYTYAQLHEQVQCMAAVLQSLGVGVGDRVQIYMPMVAEAVFAMLACARLGAIHCVVFGGFASKALASRIDDAQPKVIVSADAGSRGGKVVPYKPLLDEALALCTHQPQAVLLVDRGLSPMVLKAGRDCLWSEQAAAHRHAEVPCEWVDSAHPSYILYTSGTTGKPKGVQRDTGGYAVALASSMQHIFAAKAGQTFFCTSDIGWVVGHSYIVYAPLLAGMATVLYEGLPIRPDAGVWWRLVERYRITHMFSAPTAVRILKKHDEAWLKQYDTSSLKALWLAGEPLDQPTAHWIREALGIPVIDNYWQTETGWPILTLCNGVEQQESRLGSPGKAVYGYNVQLFDEQTGEVLNGPGRKGVLAIQGPLPPGCLQTVWRDDARFCQTYWQSVPGQEVYNTFDWGVRDEAGYLYILGRTDDVINVAGHRLGTREIEECLAGHSVVAEVAVVGVADALKGQVAMAFVVAKNMDAATDSAQAQAVSQELMQLVQQQLGAVARPQQVVLVASLPKTRSGKVLRRALQALVEQRDPGDLSTMEDPAALQQVQTALESNLAVN